MLVYLIVECTTNIGICIVYIIKGKNRQTEESQIDHAHNVMVYKLFR